MASINQLTVKKYYDYEEEAIEDRLRERLWIWIVLIKMHRKDLPKRFNHATGFARLE